MAIRALFPPVKVSVRITVRFRVRIRVRFRVTFKVRIRVRFRVRLGSGCPDYNLATLQNVILKFRIDALSVSERVKRLLFQYFLHTD